MQLGRRFRALKLWWVIRDYGVEGLQKKIRKHIQMTQDLAEKIENSNNFELLAPAPLNTICFRYKPPGIEDSGELNRINEELLERLNSTGKVYMTHTKLNGVYAIRIAVGQTYVEQRHVDVAWFLIKDIAKSIA